MTEPNNPLFEDEKEFLERKKLEYERALRGDVEEIKVQTVQAGKVALVGAGVVGGIWLLVKAFSGGKRKKHHKKGKKHHTTFEDYAGFDGFDNDSYDEELGALTAPYDSADRFTEDDGFYQGGDSIDRHYYDDDAPATADEADDNGLNDYPDFPVHSSSQHGPDDAAGAFDTTYGSHATDQDAFDTAHIGEDHGDDEGPANSFASADSYQARPYDDSRRLPESNDFDDIDSATAAAPAARKKKSRLVPAVVAFAQSEIGKIVVAQAAAVAMAFIGSKLKDILPSHEAETGKNADLAASSAPAGVPPVTWPATTAAQDVSAAAHHDDTITPREPLA